MKPHDLTEREKLDPTVEKQSVIDWKEVGAMYAVFFVIIGWAATWWLHGAVLGLLIASCKKNIKTDRQVAKEAVEMKQQEEARNQPLSPYRQMQKDEREKQYKFNQELIKKLLEE